LRRSAPPLGYSRSERYETLSTTTNLTFGEWGQAFGDERLTLALLIRDLGSLYRTAIILPSGEIVVILTTI